MSTLASSPLTTTAADETVAGFPLAVLVVGSAHADQVRSALTWLTDAAGSKDLPFTIAHHDVEKVDLGSRKVHLAEPPTERDVERLYDVLVESRGSYSEDFRPNVAVHIRTSEGGFDVALAQILEEPGVEDRVDSAAAFQKPDNAALRHSAVGRLARTNAELRERKVARDWGHAYPYPFVREIGAAGAESFLQDAALQRVACEWFMDADTLAIESQRRASSPEYWRGGFLRDPRHLLSRGKNEAIFILVAIGLLGFELNAHLAWMPDWTTFVYPACLAIAFLLLFKSGLRRDEERHRGFRSLAEALRVRTFLRVMSTDMGRSPVVVSIAEPELSWVGAAVRGVDLWLKASPTHAKHSPEELAARIEFVENYWIGDQLSYFLGEGKRMGKCAWMERAEKRVDLAARTVLVASICLALFLAVLSCFLPLHSEKSDMHGLREIWIVLISIPLAAYAVIHSYGFKRGYGAFAQRYGALAAYFARAKDEFRILGSRIGDKSEGSAMENFHKAQYATRKLAENAMIENGEWTLVQSERPADVRA